MSVKSFLKPKVKNLLKNRIVIKIISSVIFFYAQLVGFTTRWQIKDKKGSKILLNSEAILVGWHARTIMMPFFWRKLTSGKDLYALVSPHQDGQIIANFLQWYKIKVIAGSTNEKARQSALEIMRLLNEKNSVFISPDGPRGPRMRMKKSPIYFASKTGLPIICVCYSTSNAFSVKNTWDKTMVVVPFGKGIFALSTPIYIPDNLNEQQFEKYRLLVEETANKLYQSCDKKVKRKPVEPAPIDDVKKKRF